MNGTSANEGHGCDERRSKVMFVFYLAGAMIDAMQGRYVHALSATLVAMSFRTCDQVLRSFGAMAAALAHAYDGNTLGTLGFGASAAGLHTWSDGLLAFDFVFRALDSQEAWFVRVWQALVGAWYALRF